MTNSAALHPWVREGDWRNAQRATRDLIGEPAHLFVAIFAMVMEAISTATASIGFTSLVVVGLLRAPVLWPIWRAMWREWWVKVLLAWIAWSALSIAWSPDPSTGADRLWNLKFLAWIPLLWPLSHRWRWLLGGFLFATLVLQGIQVSGMYFGLRKHGLPVSAGMRHPTMAGMWNAMALSSWLFLSVIAGWRMMCLALPMAVVCAFGFFWTGQRAALVGIIVELALANFILALVAQGWLRRAITRGMIGIAILLVVYSVAGTHLTAKFNQAARETTQSLTGDTPVVMESRVAMWQLALAAWERSPIIGTGLGGYQSATEELNVRYGKGDIHDFKTPHSTYIGILTECGLVGLGLFSLWSVVMFIRAIQIVRQDPIRICALGGVIIWFSAAAFDSFNTRGVFMTVGAIMIALAVMPLYRDRLPER